MRCIIIISANKEETKAFLASRAQRGGKWEGGGGDTQLWESKTRREEGTIVVKRSWEN